MEIISYLDRGSFHSSEYTTLPLDELLRRQKKNTRKHKTPKSFSSQNTNFIIENDVELAIILRDYVQLFFKCCHKVRWAVMSIIGVCSLAIISVLVMTYVKSMPKIAEFDYAMAEETAILTAAMNNFVFEEPIDEFDANGNLSLESISPLVTLPVSFTDYTVKSGDSISSISKKFNLTNISTLIAVNNIGNVRALAVGQKLKIPSIDGIVHTVTSGNSLALIAAKYSVSVESILDVNDMDSDLIKKGDKLFIPGGKLDSDTLKRALGELFMNPLAVSYRVSSAYGYRADPFTGVKSFHTGVDFAVSQGTTIRASMSGKVATAGWNNVYGNYVIISHGNGYQTLYAHMQNYTVKTGQNVNQGERIGYVGSTGYSTGPHLHFSVYKNSKLIDPNTVIK